VVYEGGIDWWFRYAGITSLTTLWNVCQDCNKCGRCLFGSSHLGSHVRRSEATESTSTFLSSHGDDWFKYETGINGNK
jgi:hypothetical protein